MSKTIYHRLIIQANTQTIYEAITTKKGLSSWWIKDCEIKNEVGEVNTFRFEGHPPTEMKLKKQKENKYVSWKCIAGDKEWIGTKLTFSIKESENGCVLKFKHLKWKKQSAFFATCNFHWARHFIMLQNYCETGKSVLNQSTENKEIKKVKSTTKSN